MLTYQIEWTWVTNNFKPLEINRGPLNHVS